MASTVEEMIGHFIQPWPGESLLGEVIAVSGENLVCRAKGGILFEVNIAEAIIHMDWSPPKPKLQLVQAVS